MGKGQLYFGEFISPLGPVRVYLSEAGVVAIVLQPPEVKRVQRSLLRRFQASFREGPERLAPAIRVLEQYLEGKAEGIDLPADLAGLSPFQQRVLGVLQTIPFGEVRSYQWVAMMAGNPGASRAVGSVCAANPVPLLIPCHRVISKDGSLGGFRGGIGLKKRLLALEGHNLP